MARLAVLAAILPVLVAGRTLPSSSSGDVPAPTESAGGEESSSSGISFDFGALDAALGLDDPNAVMDITATGTDGEPLGVEPTATETEVPTYPPPPRPTDQFEPPPAVAVPDAPECAQCPIGASLKGQCYLDIQEAVAASTTGDVITIQGENELGAPIFFGHDLTFEGKVCGNKRPKMIGKFTAPEQGILNMNLTLYNGNATTIGYIETDPLGDWSLYSDEQPGGFDYVQVVKVSGIDFAPASKGANRSMFDTDFFDWADDYHIEIMKNQPDVYRHCGIRGPDADSAPSNGTIKLSVADCTFTNFVCKKNGSAIYIPRAEGLDIDEKSVFHNNMVYDFRDTFGGGGGLYVGFIPNGTTIQVRGNYSYNKVYFPWMNETFDGSEHGEGGAIKIDWVEGAVNISGNFLANEAPDGAAVQVMELQSVYAHEGVRVHGWFMKNRAVNMGAGARGACVRVLNANASVHISGTFADNFASDRGAVFANNWISMRSQISVKGKFTNNTCGQRGTIVSSISQFNGNVTIDKYAEFEGNQVLNMSTDAEQKTNILWVSKENAKLGEEQWYKDYYKMEDYLLVGPAGVSQGAINNWLVPDEETPANTTAAATGTETGAAATEEVTGTETETGSATEEATATTAETEDASATTTAEETETTTAATEEESATETTSAEAATSTDA